MRNRASQAFNDVMSTPARTSPGWGSSAQGSGKGRLVRRLGVVLVILGVLATILFLGGGGWYFAGQIYADGLRVKPSTPQYGQEVAAVGSGTVTIADPADEQPVLDGDDVWGLQWRPTSDAGAAVGYGQISGEGTGREDVTRELEVLTGHPPGVGDQVDLDRSAFPADAAVAAGRRVHEISYGSAEFPAWYVPGAGSTWAVLVHGKSADRTEMLRMLRSTVNKRMPSMVITYRNDAGTPQDESGIYQFGRTEWADLDAAVRYAQDRGARDVVLVGASMGGAIIASYLRNVPDAPVTGLVLDSPMLDFGQTVSYGASQRALPVFGHVPEPLTWTAKQITALRYDVDWSELDYLDDSSWLDVPTLVVHGSADSTVPVTLSEQLARAHPDEVDLMVVPDAGHVASWNTDAQRYDTALTTFLSRL